MAGCSMICEACKMDVWAAQRERNNALDEAAAAREGCAAATARAAIASDGATRADKMMRTIEALRRDNKALTQAAAQAADARKQIDKQLAEIEALRSEVAGLNAQISESDAHQKMRAMERELNEMRAKNGDFD